ncbi:L-alanine-DL-glutamate epimerase-like enolase superfamily enzyme [Neorhizobium sp. S3-V5DH]|nr:L-alanine-DL-glutamate epimerase-like enolase superfamily enzyme [Neorhizobium sp. S3-V5DH]
MPAEALDFAKPIAADRLKIKLPFLSRHLQSTFTENIMKITSIETVRIDERENLLWILVHTDEGITGLGETFYGVQAVEAHVHEFIAPRVIGRNPLQIDLLAQDLVGYIGFRSSGAEVRGNSAFDIALWDIFGKATNLPIAQLLGGFTRSEIRTYNTCAGTEYVKRNTGQQTSNYGLTAGTSYDDLNGFLYRADELAESLLEEGITAMKIWPFDPAAEKTRGQYISLPDLKSALEPFEKIRRAVGDKMDIMVEFHSMWQLLPAMQIAKALAPYQTFWHEDPIKMDSLSDLNRYVEVSPAPISASETLGSRWAFRDLLETGAAGVVMLDIGWCGGISEARKIASMAEAWHLPIAPHDCTGPVLLCASTHLSLNAPNALIQESVRAFYRTWYRDLVTALPEVKNGMITVPPGPGLGMELHPDLGKAFTVTRRISDAKSF